MIYLVPQAIDLKEFMKAFDMPDTFFSWFLVTELHVWLLGARLMQVHWRVGCGTEQELEGALRQLTRVSLSIAATEVTQSMVTVLQGPFLLSPTKSTSLINLELSGRRGMLEGW